jgi:hypothetical protein
MTLVVAVAHEHGVWLGGERAVGSFEFSELAHPKVFQLESEDGEPFLIGFSGAPRSVQVWLSANPPCRAGRSLHWWLTEYMDRVHDRLRDQGLMRDPSDHDAVFAAGDTGAVLAIDDRVFLISSELSWEEPTRGYVAQGGAYAEFGGAYEVLLDSFDRVDAARRAWPYVQRRCRVGDLIDELTLPRRD